MFQKMLLVGLSLHPYLEKTWLWSNGRQDSTGSGGSASNRGVERRLKPRGLACCPQGHLGNN